MLSFLRGPQRAEIDRHQKLLAMYRALLAEFLRQRALWDRTEVPDYLSAGIDIIRKHILDTKGTLRAWNVRVTDHPDDDGPSDQLAREVAHQRELLRIQRRNIAVYLRQRAQYDAREIPASLINALGHSRSEIQRIKAILRGWNVSVDDLPEEEPEA